MYKISTLKNGLTLITIDLPHLDSITTLVAIGAGSRYENKNNNGISHFMEHMAFKGTKKYPSAEAISVAVDSVGAVNNAGTDKELTIYWIKSANKHVLLASDILSSMVKEPLLLQEEINREKGVIVEEIRMYKDNPARYVFDLYETLQFGNQPLGWQVAGEEKIIKKLIRKDFVNYINSLYSPQNMALVYVGKLPKDIEKIAEKYFLNMPQRTKVNFKSYQKGSIQTKPRGNILYKKTDQINLILGVEGFGRNDKNKYAARLLAMILGQGMSSRLFLQVREKRGLAYHITALHNPYIDTGYFAVYGGLKLEKIEEAVKVIKEELLKTTREKILEKELQKVKEMERGRLAIRSESTNFLAEHFGIEFVLDRKLETFEEYLKKIDEVTCEDILKIAKELLKKEKFNLQMIGPLKTTALFEKILNN